MSATACDHCTSTDDVQLWRPSYWLCRSCREESDRDPLDPALLAIAWAAKREPIGSEGNVIAVPPHHKPPPFMDISVRLPEGRTNEWGGRYAELAFVPLHEHQWIVEQFEAALEDLMDFLGHAPIDLPPEVIAKVDAVMIPDFPEPPTDLKGDT